jgi:hypothetical protein
VAQFGRAAVAVFNVPFAGCTRDVSTVRIWTPPHLLALRFLATRYDCSRISGLSKTSVTEVGPRWAFARRLLIGFPGFAPVDIPRLFRRRFDLFAIARDARNRDR